MVSLGHVLFCKLQAALERAFPAAAARATGVLLDPKMSPATKP
jgi:hypothetical protein